MCIRSRVRYFPSVSVPSSQSRKGPIVSSLWTKKKNLSMSRPYQGRQAKCKEGEVGERRPCSATQQNKDRASVRGEERGWRWQRGGGKKLPADQFHGSLPEEALVLLQPAGHLIPNIV